MAELSTAARVLMRAFLETLDPAIAILLIGHEIDMAFALV
jgi:hypothetical protein